MDQQQSDHDRDHDRQDAALDTFCERAMADAGRHMAKGADVPTDAVVVVAQREAGGDWGCQCPRCQYSFVLPPSGFAGVSIECPGCGKPLLIDAPTQAG